MSDKPELLPCPFCGSDARVDFLDAPGCHRAAIECLTCRTHTKWVMLPEEAALIWNKRNALKELETLVSRYREVLGVICSNIECGECMAANCPDRPEVV